MTSERAIAYGRVLDTINEMGGSKLLPREQHVIREAADALFFCEDLAADTEASDTLAAARGLAEHLIETGRWIPATGERLLSDLAACGPLLPVGPAGVG